MPESAESDTPHLICMERLAGCTTEQRFPRDSRTAILLASIHVSHHAIGPALCPVNTAVIVVEVFRGGLDSGSPRSSMIRRRPWVNLQHSLVA
jgi:hypothetical protein